MIGVHFLCPLGTNAGWDMSDLEKHDGTDPTYHHLPDDPHNSEEFAHCLDASFCLEYPKSAIGRLSGILSLGVNSAAPSCIKKKTRTTSQGRQGSIWESEQ